MVRVTNLDSFHDFILEELGKTKLARGKAIIDQLSDAAGDWVITAIVQNHLPQSEQELFRDCYLSAPDIFDPIEFLYSSLPNLNELLRHFTAKWIAHVRTS